MIYFRYLVNYQIPYKMENAFRPQNKDKKIPKIEKASSRGVERIRDLNLSLKGMAEIPVSDYTHGETASEQFSVVVL